MRWRHGCARLRPSRAGVAQSAERLLPKQKVASSNLVSRSTSSARAWHDAMPSDRDLAASGSRSVTLKGLSEPIEVVNVDWR